jgi:predicted nucleotidyltransferase
MDTAIALHRLSQETLADFARRWDLLELAVFGSVLRDDFGAESDIDVLVTFRPGHKRTVFDHLRMEEELSRLLARRVEITSRGALDEGVHPQIRDEILGTAHVLYAA